jgi:hypothetical protein
MGSLGRLYRRDVADFPRRPYLSAPPAIRAHWAERLGPRPEGLRIGISWTGGLKQTRAERRSLPLAQLRPLLDLPGCEVVSLQYGDVADEVAAVNAGLATPVRLFPAEDLDDFADLAGLVQSLDVVVSVQNSLVHLCGALGQRCLTMVPHAPEWRYGASGSTMPWYGSVELFRQPEPRAWEPVIEQVRQALLAPR